MISLLIQKSVYVGLLRFLGVNETFLPRENRDSSGFKIFNASKTTKSETLKRLTIASPQWMKVIGKKNFSASKQAARLAHAMALEGEYQGRRAKENGSAIAKETNCTIHSGNSKPG